MAARSHEMASDEELGLALRNSCMDIVPDAQSEGWSGLPPELLEIIGSKLTEGAHLHSAAMVCKSWNQSIPTGLTSMEVDMHSDPSMWRFKIEKLQSLIRHLRTVAIHVNAAISDDMLVQNIALVQQLQDVSELKLHLREGCDLPPAAATAIGSMRHLTSLTIVGGGLKPEAAAGLLTGLASASAAAAAAAAVGAGPCGGGLRALRLLPSVPHGLGDTEMALLAACSSLEVLEFRAYRLTSAGLATLSLGLPRLSRLAITSLDSDSGYELACLERLAALAELDLALDNAPLGAASRRALCSVRPGRSLSLSFRWTDKAQGLLTEYGQRLANLTHLDVGACRVGSESLFEAVAQLTGLRELRMAVYSNADHCIPCHLSRLSALAALQRFHLEKRKAYFPEARRFGESSIAVPVTAEGLRALAGRWSRLRSLRLALSRKDYSPEALSVLSSFTGLRELGILVERCQQAAGGGGSSSSSSGASAGTPHSPRSTYFHYNPQQQQQDDGQGAARGEHPAAAAAASNGGGRLSRRALEPPPLLDLSCLPPGLLSLELNNLMLDLSDQQQHQQQHQQHEQYPQQYQPAEAAAAGAAYVPVAPAAAAAQNMGSLGLGLASTVAHGAALGPSAGNVLLPFPTSTSTSTSTAAIAATGGAAAHTTAAPPPPPPPPLPLSQLTSLDVEACVVRPPLLALVARRCGGCLRSLRLAGVVGLSDGVLAECLPALPALRSLAVTAPGNRAVSQAGLAALSSAGPAAAAAAPAASTSNAADTAILGGVDAGGGVAWRRQEQQQWGQQRRPPTLPLLRQLTWESDDLTARGPDIRALAPLTSLRHLYLSCTDKTAERALGSLRVLQDALPYCHVDMVWTAARPGGDAP